MLIMAEGKLLTSWQPRSREVVAGKLPETGYTLQRHVPSDLLPLTRFHLLIAHSV
jgi:hypothetical protein